MKQRLGRLIAVAAACLLLCMLVPTAAFAAGDAYTYTVTLAMGRQGIYTGTGVQVESASARLSTANGVVTIRNLHYGDRVSLDQSAAAVGDNSKYYVKGVRIGGRDNNTAAAPSFSVTADADYVMAYGIKGDLTQYTVRYVDAAGNALAASRTYYGNVGDKPVVAYLYVDGYQPQSYNLTKTLTANTAENVFTFVYTKLSNGNGGGSGDGSGDGDGGADSKDPGEIVIYVTPSPRPGTRATATPGAASEQTAASGEEDTTEEDTPEEEVVVVESPAPAPTAAAGGGNAADNGTADGQGGAAAPEELTDIDANQTPLASFIKQVVETVANATPIAKVGMGALLALLILLLILLIGRKKNKKRKETPTDGQ